MIVVYDVMREDDYVAGFPQLLSSSRPQIEEQVKLLQKGVTHIGVGTPGRVSALIEKGRTECSFSLFKNSNSLILKQRFRLY